MPSPLAYSLYAFINGIIVTENLKVSEQCAKVTKAANKVLGIIKWSYEDKSIANLLPLYKMLVRPAFKLGDPTTRRTLII